MHRYLAGLMVVVGFGVGAADIASGADDANRWIDEIVNVPAAGQPSPALPQIKLIRQDHEHLEFRQSAIYTHRYSPILVTHSCS